MNKKKEEIMPITQDLMKSTLRSKFPLLDEKELDSLTFQLVTVVMLGMMLDVPPTSKGE